MNILSPTPKRKSHRAATRWLQILRVLADALNTFIESIYTMSLPIISTESKRVLGLFPDDGVRLAIIHVIEAQKLFCTCPTTKNRKSYQIAVARLAHACFVSGQQNVQVST